MPADRLLQDWLASYLEYTSKQESPEKLHFWTGLVAIGAALKRQVWMNRGYYKLYPNIYVLLVAESAMLRKSTAMDIGIGLLRDAVPDLYYISGSMTPEGLIKHMNRVKVIGGEKGKQVIKYDSHVLIHADELAELFGFDKTRASKLTILLTKIYGAQAEHTHTLATEGQLLLRNLYPSFLAGTDPRNLKVLPEEAVAGLIGRLVFVTASEKRQPIAWPTPSASDRALYQKLKSDLNTISSLTGEIKVTQQSHDCFEEWYNGLGSKKQEDTRLEAFRERCHDTALKIAMLLSISSTNTLTLEHPFVERGIEHIERQIPEFGKVANWAAASSYAQNRAKFIDLLRRQGGVGFRKQALKALAISLDELVILENSLEAEQILVCKLSGKNMIYKLSKEEQ